MASKSGSFTATGKNNYGYNLKFSWSLSQNKEKNTSTISWQVDLIDNVGYVWGDSITLTLAGEKIEIVSSTRQQLKVGKLKSGKKTITHNSDGTKSFSASLVGSIYSSSMNMKGSGSWTLPTIARVGTITYFNDAPIIGGGPYSIKMKKASSGVTTALRYQLSVNGAWTNEDNGVILSSWDSKNSCYYWDMRGKMGQELENKMNGAASVKLKIIAITKYNDKEIGRSSVERTLKSGRATCSINNTTIGNRTNITINKPSRQSLTLKIYYTFGNKTDIIKEYTSTDNDFTKTIPWTPEDSLHSEFSGASAAGTLFVQTFSDGYSLGTRNHGFTLYANPNKKPTITITAKDTNLTALSLTGNNQTIIKGISNVQVNYSASVESPAKIVDLKVWNNSKYQTSNPATFNNVITPNYEVYAKDSRGFENSKRVTLNMIDYVSPTCNINVDKIDTNGNTTIHLKGNYFNNSFGAVNNTYSLQYVIKNGETIITDWTVVTPTFNGNSYSIDIPIKGLNYQKAYQFQGYIKDKLKEKYSEVLSVKSLPVFDWGENDFNFNVPVKFSEGLTTPLSTANGGTGVSNLVDLKKSLSLDAVDNTPDNKKVVEGSWCIKDVNTGNNIFARYNGAGLSNNVTWVPAYTEDKGYICLEPIHVTNLLKSMGVDGSIQGNQHSSYMRIGKLLVCWGYDTITPSAAKTPTLKDIYFPTSFTIEPTVFLTVKGGPQIATLTLSHYSTTTSSFEAYIFASNTTTRGFNWLAIGY